MYICAPQSRVPGNNTVCYYVSHKLKAEISDVRVHINIHILQNVQNAAFYPVLLTHAHASDVLIYVLTHKFMRRQLGISLTPDEDCSGPAY